MKSNCIFNQYSPQAQRCISNAETSVPPSTHVGRTRVEVVVDTTGRHRHRNIYLEEM
jgi:hypothetical protein